MAQPGRPKSDAPRNHRIGCGMSDAELENLDKLRGGVSRGEYLRRAALDKAPRTIPELNRTAWADLGRALGNLSTIATAMRGGEYRQIEEIRAAIKDLRQTLIGAKK